MKRHSRHKGFAHELRETPAYERYEHKFKKEKYDEITGKKPTFVVKGLKEVKFYIGGKK